ncbi:hypothetical protein CpipJ_CPIJ004056, partial [Culex quinquefasciatus]
SARHVSCPAADGSSISSFDVSRIHRRRVRLKLVQHCVRCLLLIFMLFSRIRVRPRFVASYSRVFVM